MELEDHQTAPTQEQAMTAAQAKAAKPIKNPAPQVE